MTIHFNAFGEITHSDIHGNPVERTKEKYPYSYDSTLIWGDICGNYPEYGFVYSDRESALRFLSYSEQRDPSIVEKILKEKVDENITLVAIAEEANKSSGYPVLLYGFKRRDMSEVKEGLFA